jgi:hypothetical protein
VAQIAPRNLRSYVAPDARDALPVESSRCCSSRRQERSGRLRCRPLELLDFVVVDDDVLGVLIDDGGVSGSAEVTGETSRRRTTTCGIWTTTGSGRRSRHRCGSRTARDFPSQARRCLVPHGALPVRDRRSCALMQTEHPTDGPSSERLTSNYVALPATAPPNRCLSRHYCRQ